MSVCTEEMARPDWVQKAKHLADTCQVAKREWLPKQKHCCDFCCFRLRERAVGNGHDGKLIPATRQVCIHFPVAGWFGCHFGE